jgi:hypothetical protein
MLPGTEGARSPDWYVDGSSIVFATSGEVEVVDAEGNGRRKLAELDGWSAKNPGGVYDYGGSTSDPSGVTLFGNTVLRCIHTWFRPSPQTEPCEPMVRSDLDTSLNETYHRAPWFLPDGQHFLFQVWSSSPGNRAVYIGAVNSPGRKRLMTSESKAIYVQPGFLLFLQGPILMAQPFDADRLEITGEPVAIANDVAFEEGGPSGFYASGAGTLIYQRNKPADASGGTPVMVVLNWANRIERRPR